MKFVKEGFRTSGPYLYFDGKFVARFKHKPGSAGTFRTFLIKNFTVEEYFGLLEKGVAPLHIVESKGYVLPHISAWVKSGVVQQESVDRWIAAAKEKVAAAGI
jgi:hypothetical protein